MRPSFSLPLLFVALAALAACSTFSDRRGFNRAVNDRRVQITAQHALDNDTALSGKVRIDTSVYDGVLLLIGEAPTQELKDRAQADVTGYEGVRRIENQIDVMPIPPFAERAADPSLTARAKIALLNLTSLPGFDPGRVKISSAHGNVYLLGLVSHREADAVVDVVRHVAGVQQVVKVFEYTD
ncbi:MAG: BON domain-containing protein [Rhodanobacteraceae bacterium]